MDCKEFGEQLISMMDTIPSNIRVYFVIEDIRINKVVRINRGFNALELLGLLTRTTQEILIQNMGLDAPEVIKKVILEPISDYDANSLELDKED